jgi:REP element-mobilizing transposase RayT
LEFAGAFYHVTARGDRQEPIFLADSDRRTFLDLLNKEVTQQGWRCYAYCLMKNHYHLLLETPEPNLVRGMRRLNGVYTQAFNRRRKQSGHVFQGRYKAILVDKDHYLLELCRYIVLNPIRAKMVKKPEEYNWSSYRATAKMIAPPTWLAVEEVLRLFAGSRATYRKFVREGLAQPSVWEELRGQIYLGDDRFLARMQALVDSKVVQGISKAHRTPKRPHPEEILTTVGQAYGLAAAQVLDRSHPEAYWVAVYLLRRVGNLSLREVAGRVGVTAARISQIQTKMEQGRITKQAFAVLSHYKLKP